MADRRRQIYYTKAQLKEGLITSGKEWMFTDGVEYVGQYHTYTTGEVFSLTKYIEGKSRILIPYVAVITDSEAEPNVIDTQVKFEYDDIKRVTITVSRTPVPRIITPTQLDYQRGYMTRYFAKKINETLIIEINFNDFNEVGSENGLDSNIWKVFSLKWKISGKLVDELDSNGNVVNYGVLDTNQRTINAYERDYRGIRGYLSNPQEFYIQ